jgi:hypothetical protein
MVSRARRPNISATACRHFRLWLALRDPLASDRCSLAAVPMWYQNASSVDGKDSPQNPTIQVFSALAHGKVVGSICLIQVPLVVLI